MAAQSPLTSILSTQAQAPTSDPAAAAAAQAGAENAQTAAQAPAPAAAHWADALPEAYRNDAHLRAHASQEAMLAEYGALKQNAGQSIIPDWKAPFEQHKDFFTKIGVPETPDKYGIKVPDDFPVKDFPINEEFLGKMQAAAHKFKIPAEAFQGFVSEYMGLEKGLIEGNQQAAAQAQAAQLDTLKSTWGTNFDTQCQFAAKGFQQFADAGMLEKLQGAGITENAAFVQLMAKVGEAMALPNSPGARSTSGSAVQQHIVTTPQQAMDALKTMQADSAKMEALHNPKHQFHKQVNAEMDALYLKAYS